jgi:hypothetical protein
MQSMRLLACAVVEQLRLHSRGKALPSGCEKRLEKRGTVGGQQARGDFDSVVQAGMRKYFEAGADGASFWVIAAIHQSRNAGLNYGASAHAARFDGDVESRRSETIVANCTGAFAEDYHFGVRRGVAVADGAISRTCNDFSLLHQDGSDGHLAGRPGSTSFIDRLAHEFEIGVHEREDSTQGKVC